MPPALKLFGYFALSAFVLSSVVYFVMHSISPYVFAGLFRMFMYHESHPLQYIAIVAITYAVIATVCVLRLPKLTRWRQRAAIVAIMLLSVIMASVPGGILWKIHDMQAGFFTTGERFWSDLFWGASTGLSVGWMVIALSIPYNVIGLIVGYRVTGYGFNLAAKLRAENSALP